jgi:hypothetical protein
VQSEHFHGASLDWLESEISTIDDDDDDEGGGDDAIKEKLVSDDEGKDVDSTSEALERLIGEVENSEECAADNNADSTTISSTATATVATAEATNDDVDDDGEEGSDNDAEDDDDDCAKGGCTAHSGLRNELAGAGKWRCCC